MKLWLLCFAATVCMTATLCAQTGARITGRITTEGALPLRGEVIAVINDGAVRISRVLSDEQGLFTIDVPAGSALLVAKADGYVSEERQLLTRPGAGNAAVQFMLAPAGSVSGRVLDENGVGVAGARVWVDYRGEVRHWQPAEETGGEATDNLGYFSLPVIAQRRPFVLHAEAEGWLLSSSGTLILHARELADVVLLLNRHGTRVLGQVVDAAGNPVAGAEVRLRSLPANDEFTAEQRASIAFARSANRTTISAADGSYVFAGVPAGQVIVTASSGGRRAASQAITAAGRETDIILALH